MANNTNQGCPQSHQARPAQVPATCNTPVLHTQAALPTAEHPDTELPDMGQEQTALSATRPPLAVRPPAIPRCHHRQTRFLHHPKRLRHPVRHVPVRVPAVLPVLPVLPVLRRIHDHHERRLESADHRPDDPRNVAQSPASAAMDQPPVRRHPATMMATSRQIGDSLKLTRIPQIQTTDPVH